MKLVADGISKRYIRKMGGANFFDAVKPLSLTLETGSLTVLTGRSGSGKTTLLTMLAGLLTPSEGKVLLDDTDIYTLPDVKLSRLRKENFAFLTQTTGAIDSLTVLENILLPASSAQKSAAMERAARLMEALDITNLRDAYPNELSGGELRRMATVRALSGDAKFIFADEPTGDLDDENTRAALSLFKQAASEGKAVIISTHEQEARAYADRLYKMDAGEIVEVLE